MSHRPFVLGVTGGIACGKSTVLRRLAVHGFDTIDADQVYRELIVAGSPLLGDLVDHFGPEVLAADGTLDRTVLGAIVFADREKLADLDRITHPAIVEEIVRRIGVSPSTTVAIDAVKLFESGMHRLCNQTWLIECRPETEVRRLMARNGLSAHEAKRRVAAQGDFALARSGADAVIANDGDELALEESIAQALQDLHHQ